MISTFVTLSCQPTGSRHCRHRRLATPTHATANYSTRHANPTPRQPRHILHNLTNIWPKSLSVRARLTALGPIHSTPRRKSPQTRRNEHGGKPEAPGSAGCTRMMRSILGRQKGWCLVSRFPRARTRNPPHRSTSITAFLCLAAAGLVPEPQLSGQTVSDFTIALRSEPPSEA
jgi:hypothetical protein